MLAAFPPRLPPSPRFRATADEWPLESGGVARPPGDHGEAAAYYRVDADLHPVTVSGNRHKLPAELDDYVCISVPHHVVLPGDEVRPAAARPEVEKFDPNKSFNLSTHCVQGWGTVALGVVLDPLALDPPHTPARTRCVFGMLCGVCCSAVPPFAV